MNIKKALLFIILILPFTCVLSQNKVVEKTTIISSQDTPSIRMVREVTHFDVSDNRPKLTIVTDSIVGGITSTNCYYKYRGKSREVFPSVVFIEGRDSLQEDFSLYFWENYFGNEVNASCIYVMLFNDKLKIKDISIIVRSGYNNSQYDFDKLITDFLYSTEGKWKIIHEYQCNRWYYVVGRIFVR